MRPTGGRRDRSRLSFRSRGCQWGEKRMAGAMLFRDRMMQARMALRNPSPRPDDSDPDSDAADDPQEAPEGLEADEAVEPNPEGWKDDAESEDLAQPADPGGGS